MPCEKPIKVQKNGEIYYYPCGKCACCLNSKSHLLEQCTRFEAQNSEFLLFGTLTYRNSDLPTVEVVSRDISDVQCLVSWVSRTDRITQRLGDDLLGDKIIPIEKKEFYLRPLRFNKSRLEEPNTFGILFYRDVQLFIKRLRRRIDTLWLKKYSTDNNIPLKCLTYEERKKILQTVPRYRFLCVGEYGPKTFRPHYHILFFVNSEWLQSAIRGLFGTLWSYGRTDLQLSYGQASSYVSSYLNSYLSLPPVIKDVTSRSVVHSTSFGWFSAKETFEDIREVRYSDLAARILVYSGKSHVLRVPFSLENDLFPKTFGYGESADSTLLRRYTSYRYLSRVTGLESVSDIIDFYVRWFNLDGEDFGPNHNDSPRFDWVAPDVLLSYNQRFTSMLGYEYDSDFVIPELRTRLMSILYTSRLFLRNCARFGISEHEYFGLIRKYYKDKDQIQLAASLEDMQTVNNPQVLLEYYGNIRSLVDEEDFDLLENYLDPGIDNSEMIYYAFYPDENPLRRSAIEQSRCIARNKVKHKTQNDLNNFLIYD